MTDVNTERKVVNLSFEKQRDNSLKVNIEKNGVVRHAEILTCSDSVYQSLIRSSSTQS